MSTVLGSDPIPSPKFASSESPASEKELISLRAECAILREKLAAAETESLAYRSAFYARERSVREFADIDFPELAAMSAGPVELI